MSKILRCPTCNQINKEFIKLDDKTYQCDVCNTTFYMMSEKETIALEQARNYHAMYEFTKADYSYKKILEKTDNEETKVMCYMGRLLASFGVIFIKDRNGFLITTFSKYDPDITSIKNTEYYKEIMASEYALNYVDLLEKIEKEYQNIRNELKNKPEYDVFICVKITNSTEYEPLNEERTKDSKIAKKIYDELRNRNLKVFYSEESLTGDIKYDGQIYSSLLNSRSLLVISSSRHYLESPWVQSEWQRWLNLIDRKIKKSNSLFFYQTDSFQLPPIIERVQKYRDKETIVDKIDRYFEDLREKEITEAIRTAQTHMRRANFEYAEEILSSLCEEFREDYRPWIGLVDYLIYTKVPNDDPRFETFLDNALRLADQKEKMDIESRYKKYIVKKEEVTIEQELNDASTLAIFGNFKEAESKYISLCRKYVDYRIWVGLLELLKLQSVDQNDQRYQLYLSKALDLCNDSNIKESITKKYRVEKNSSKEEPKVKPAEQENDKTLDEELNEASTLAIFGNFKEAETMYIALCKKHVDYRIWVGLLELLKLQSINLSDKRYEIYLSKALDLCNDSNVKEKLIKKYQANEIKPKEEQKIEKVEPQKELSLEEELDEASTLALFGKYSEAEEKYMQICLKNPDYRVWTGLLDLLRLQNIGSEDPRYEVYFTKAIQHCPIKMKNELKEKYTNLPVKALSPKKDIENTKLYKELEYMYKYNAKLGAIKLVKEAFGFSLKEAKELVDNSNGNLEKLLISFDYNPQVFFEYKNTPEETSSIKKVQYNENEFNEVNERFRKLPKIDRIKLIKSITKTGLKESKEAVDKSPTDLKAVLDYINFDYGKFLLLYKENEQQEITKPVVKETPKPVVKEITKPVVKETPKPVVKETPRPVVSKTKEQIEKEAKALYDEGYKYYKGNGVTKDLAKAFSLFQKAAEGGNPDAYFRLGWMYESSEHVKQSYPEALKWYMKAAEFDDMYALHNIGVFYERGRGVSVDYATALNYYLKAAKLGYSGSQYNAGIFYANGYGCTKDYSLAMKYYKLAADQGHSGALNNIGSIYENANGVTKDYYEASKWYKKAADKGSAIANKNLGELYYYGRGVTQSYSEAYKYFKAGADKGNARSYTWLGFFYEKGYNVSIDLATAVSWYKKAANAGDSWGNRCLAFMYYNGRGITKNVKEAVKYYKIAADKGDTTAQREYAIMCYYGNDCDQSYEQAYKYFKLAADKKDASAQNYMGVLYGKGYYVQKNDTEAVKWYKLAADQGEMYAQSNLAYRYRYGKGVTKNLYEAVRLYKLSANQGYAKAQYNLADMYENGLGVTQSYKEAKRLFELAAAQNYSDAADRAKKLKLKALFK